MPAVSKFSDELAKQLCDYLRRGHPKRSACALVGIHRDTCTNWENRGRRARSRREEGLRVTAAEAKFERFVDDVEQAYDYGEGWLFEQMLDAAAGGKDTYLKRWQAYMTALERSRPDVWRRRTSAEYVEQGKPGKRPSIDVSRLSGDERSELRELLLRAMADG